MSLSVTGECIVSIPRTIKSKKDGAVYNFNDAHICDTTSNSEPVKVNTYELVLVKGKFYNIPVSTSTFNGQVQLNVIENSPPQEIVNLGEKVGKT